VLFRVKYVKDVVRIAKIVHDPVGPVATEIMNAVTIYLCVSHNHSSTADQRVIYSRVAHTDKASVAESINPVLQNC
jgi:hypothetical protein